MLVVINGQSEAISETTLDELCKRFHEEPTLIATAVNGQFVALGERAALSLQEGDRIEILSPRQGG